MKNRIFLLLIFINISAFSQMVNSEDTPKKLVENFFEAFHAQDTITLKKFARQGAKLESVSVNAEGHTQFTSDDYSKFLKGIISIPADVSFEEKLHDFRVEQNGLLATVTTPYSFYFNGKLSHCGVNSFQLVKFGGEWKIVYLIDTRTRENCEQFQG